MVVKSSGGPDPLHLLASTGGNSEVQILVRTLDSTGAHGDGQHGCLRRFKSSRVHFGREISGKAARDGLTPQAKAIMRFPLSDGSNPSASISKMPRDRKPTSAGDKTAERLNVCNVRTIAMTWHFRTSTADKPPAFGRIG